MYEAAWRAFEAQQQTATGARFAYVEARKPEFKWTGLDLSNLPIQDQREHQQYYDTMRGLHRKAASELGNASSPLPAALEWAALAESEKERIKRAGKVASVSGRWLLPNPGYNAQEVTDTDARARLNTELQGGMVQDLEDYWR